MLNVVVCSIALLGSSRYECTDWLCSSLHIVSWRQFILRSVASLAYWRTPVPVEPPVQTIPEVRACPQTPCDCMWTAIVAFAFGCAILPCVELLIGSRMRGLCCLRKQVREAIIMELFGDQLTYLSCN